MSAASFISMAGVIFLFMFTGYVASVLLNGLTVASIVALFLAPYLRKFGKFTGS